MLIFIFQFESKFEIKIKEDETCKLCLFLTKYSQLLILKYFKNDLLLSCLI